jgi:hypothetical protein
MLMTILKALGTAAVVLILSEIAKRWTFLAAAVAALPLMTMLVVANLALDFKNGGGIAKANEFAMAFFYLFWPGLLFFIVLPVAQKLGVSFWWSFALAVIVTFGATWGVIVALKALGVKVS